MTWTVVNGACSASDQVDVTYFEPTTAIAGNDQSICTKTATLDADDPTVGTGQWSMTSGPVGSAVTFGDEYSYSSTATVTLYGTHTFKWTVTNGSCVSTDEVVVYYIEPPIADAGIDQTISCGFTTTMAANDPVLSTGTWSQISGPGEATFADVNGASSEVTIPVYGVYKFK